MAVVVASYRGPAKPEDGRNPGATGAGGLIQVLQPWAQERAALWAFAAEAGSAAPAATESHSPVEINDEHRRGHYEVVSNSILWPLFHGLEGWAAERFRTRAAADREWDAFRAVNRLFAERIAARAPAGSTVVVHDYQLLLLPGLLRETRPDLDVVYFHHIPFASAAELCALPQPWRQEIADSLGGCRSGFQSRRWKRSFLEFSASEGNGAPPTFVAPVGPELRGLTREARSDEVAELRRTARARAGGRKLIVRVDRADPMKNVIGGLRAVDLLLTREPCWRGEFVFAHHLVPTRSTIASYRRHLAEILRTADAVNAKWAGSGWHPINVNVEDRRAYGIALLAEYDVLLVNPVREGMNLVAHEGPAINGRSGIVVLSEEAGAHDLLAPAALAIDPRSQEDTAAALARALAMSPGERADRAQDLALRVASLNRDSWHDEVVRAGRP